MTLHKTKSTLLKKQQQDSLPGLVHLKDLKPGDILLFKPPEKLSFTQKLLMFMQALTRQKHGHYDSTHAAICISNEGNKPFIAHISAKPYVRGDEYVREPLDSYLKRIGEPAFILFRPPVDAAYEIAEVAANEKNVAAKWSFFTSIGRFLQKSKPDPHKAPEPLPKMLSRNTVSSKFVTECIQIGMEKSGNQSNNLHLRSNSSPKALESALYTNGNFTMHCYLEPKAFEKLAAEINNQLKRFYNEDTRGGVGSKHLKVGQAYLTALHELKRPENKHLNELGKCLFLLDTVLPSLKESTGLGLLETTSHKAVMGVARKIGIFQRDIKEYSKRVHSNDGHTKAEHKHKKLA